MTDYKLYGGGVTRSAVIEAVLKELGLGYELVAIDPLKGENRTAAYLKLNPTGFVPTLVTPEGEAITQTVAMALYLAERHDAGGLAPAPSDPDRGRFLARLFFLNNDIDSRTKTFFYPHRWSTAEADAPRIRDKAFDNLIARWRIYDTWLAEAGPFALGSRFSLADLFMALWAAYGLHDTGDITGRFAHVARCYDLVVARPKSGPVIAGLRQALDDWKSTGAMDGSVTR
jgi:glutathione S-transferase